MAVGSTRGLAVETAELGDNMPILGAGLIPSGPIGLELEATVRRVFAQMVVVLIYRQNPLLALLLRNAIRASGGVSGGVVIGGSYDLFCAILPPAIFLTQLEI